MRGEYLHDIVVFVGDRPNPKKNISMSVPFVGTKSYKTLLEWFYQMNVDIERVMLVNAFDVAGAPRPYQFPNFAKYVALGETASSYLKGLEIKHFKLPHPSGLNRVLNDEESIAKSLLRCKKYIYKKT